VLLPITKAVIINHQPSHYANTKLCCFSRLIEDDEVQTQIKVEARNITELADSPTCPLDLEFYATRNIMAGKELFMDYEEDWEEEWLQARCHDVE
jgi:hypothetical protein